MPPLPRSSTSRVALMLLPASREKCCRPQYLVLLSLLLPLHLGGSTHAVYHPKFLLPAPAAAYVTTLERSICFCFTLPATLFSSPPSLTGSYAPPPCPLRCSSESHCRAILQIRLAKGLRQGISQFAALAPPKTAQGPRGRSIPAHASSLAPSLPLPAWSGAMMSRAPQR